MNAVAFIGDELTATGFALAGVRIYVTPPAGATEALRVARESADLVLIAAAHARAIEAAELDAALVATRPLTVVVEDMLGREAPPDLEKLMRRALGVDIA